MSSSAKLIRKSSTLRTVNVIGDYWILLILRDTFLGLHRCSELKEATPITHATLSSRLKRMLAADLLRRDRAGSGRAGQAYRLTAKGRDLYRVMMLLADWERRWFTPPGQMRSRNLFTHTVCGRRANPVLICGHCREPVTFGSVTAEDGPGAGYEPAAPGRMQRQAAICVDEALNNPRGITAAAAIIGDRWSAAILAVTFRRCKRFDEYLDYLKISPHILSVRLAAFIEYGMLERRAYQASPARYDYVLTPKAIDLYPVIIAMGHWGDRWLDDGSGPPIVTCHRTCGATLDSVLSCSACRGNVDLAAISSVSQYRVRAAS